MRVPDVRPTLAAACVAAALCCLTATPSAQTTAQLFEGHEAVLAWHDARLDELGVANSAEAMLGPVGRLKLLVNPLLAGDGSGATLPREVYERPDGAPLPDESAEVLGECLPRTPSSLHSTFEQVLAASFNRLLDNRVDVCASLTRCIDESVVDTGAAVVLAADVLLEADPDDADVLLADIELRLLRVSVKDAEEPGPDGEPVRPIRAVELLWSDRHVGRGRDDDAVLDAFDKAIVDALSGGLVPNLWGDPGLLEVDWFREREGVVGASLRDAFAGEEEGP